MGSVKNIKNLHENVDQFFKKSLHEQPESYHCKKGCSSCCHTDISVFPIEAHYIILWFNSLTAIQQNSLREIWKNQLASLRSGSKEVVCVFLSNDQCTIYDARPTICRSQGLALFFEADNSIDHCPLNFTIRAPEKSESLNLDRLNTLISIAQLSFDKETNEELRDLVVNGRVKLTSLKSYLIDAKQ